MPLLECTGNRLLLLAPRFIFPPSFGSEIDIFERAQFLRRIGWDIRILACGETNGEKDNRGTVSGFDVYYIHRPERFPKSEKPAFVSFIQSQIDEWKPSTIWCEYSDLANAVSMLDLHGARLFFRSHNFELAHFLEKGWEHTTRFLSAVVEERKSIFRWWLTSARQSIHIARRERKMLKIADAIFFVSWTDMQLMKRFYGGKAINNWLPPYVSGKYLPVHAGRSILNVLYNGANYANNVNMSGARVLLEEIVPLANRRFPGAFQFHLCGKEGSKRLKEWESECVVIHDYVEDYQSFIADMDVACLPIRYGMGCKTKMIEAFATGLPVVGYRQVFRGIPYVPIDYMACKSSDDVVEALSKLMNANERLRVAGECNLAHRAWSQTASKTMIDILNTASMGKWVA
jgi:glycosyltransferase involved in cell wall biosynthesis